ncbi:MAG: hypothetical protein VKJ24_16055 [Synechococcales bacterium]|nr:hypothetical protein [Synechococcales bacterium]
MDADITPELLQTIDILEGLEALLDQSPRDDIAAILGEAWLKVSATLPADLQAATQEDAGAEGLRRYLRVKAFFNNPMENPIRSDELEAYYHNRIPIDEQTAEFLFPEEEP